MGYAERIERAYASHRTRGKGGGVLVDCWIQSPRSLEGGHVLEVGEESRLRVGEGERWRRRVIRSTIRRAGAFEKMGRGRGGGVRGGAKT